MALRQIREREARRWLTSRSIRSMRRSALSRALRDRQLSMNEVAQVLEWALANGLSRLMPRVSRSNLFSDKRRKDQAREVGSSPPEPLRNRRELPALRRAIGAHRASEANRLNAQPDLAAKDMAAPDPGLRRRDLTGPARWTTGRPGGCIFGGGVSRPNRRRAGAVADSATERRKVPTISRGARAVLIRLHRAWSFVACRKKDSTSHARHAGANRPFAKGHSSTCATSFMDSLLESRKARRQRASSLERIEREVEPPSRLALGEFVVRAIAASTSGRIAVGSSRCVCAFSPVRECNPKQRCQYSHVRNDDFCFEILELAKTITKTLAKIVGVESAQAESTQRSPHERTVLAKHSLHVGRAAEDVPEGGVKTLLWYRAIRNKLPGLPLLRRQP